MAEKYFLSLADSDDLEVYPHLGDYYLLLDKEEDFFMLDEEDHAFELIDNASNEDIAW